MSSAEEKVDLSPLQKGKRAVEELYIFRDRYFEDHSLDQAAQKNSDVEKKLDETLKSLDDLQGDDGNKADWLTLRGMALNIKPGYDDNAAQCLSKAIKLEPKLVDAWVHLGECYWKNSNVEGARDCFTGALNHGKDKKALQNLSMVLRQFGKDATEKFKLIEESVEKAKEAVQMDIKDGTSWFILGNAYLSLFFASTQNPAILKQCFSAYQQAERDVVASSNPDLHFNRATAYKYEEAYELALQGFGKAAALDPGWSEPQEKQHKLVQYLTSVQDLVRAKGKVKPKKLMSMVSSIKESDLGAYAGGSFTPQRGEPVPLTQSHIAGLQEGPNKNKVVLGRVVCSIAQDEAVPFTFCMVDQESQCVCVTIYNIAPGYGVKIGDSVAIPEPHMSNVQLKYNNKEFSFPNIRVESPLVLVVNGRKLGLDKQAPSVLAVSAMSE